MDPLDYSLLDRPELLQFMFYPRREWRSPSADAIDHYIPVQDGISVSARFYPSEKHSPSILFFHGNGEVASDYDGIAPFYNQMGINLFVADYRGYGKSDGTPSISSMVADAYVIFDSLRTTLDREGYTDIVYLMGRSLGAYSALELAVAHPSIVRGVISESGAASITGALSYFPFQHVPGISDLGDKHDERMRSVTIPLLIIHGELDTLVPIEMARDLYELVGSEEKRFITVPGAGHNNLLAIDSQTYFQSIKDFVFANRQETATLDGERLIP